MTFTRHGHHIPDTSMANPPMQRARCGGVLLCRACQADASDFHSHPSARAKKKDISMQVTKFTRRKFNVDAVQVTKENMEQVATWCGGTIKETEKGAKYVEVDSVRPLNMKHTRAFVGDWVSISDGKYKVYTNRAFLGAFEEANEGETLNVFTDTEELRVTDEPVPTEEPEEEKKDPTAREALGFDQRKNLMKE